MLLWFLDAAKDLPRTAFLSRGKFTITSFEAIFAAACQLRDNAQFSRLDASALERIRADTSFIDFAQYKTTDRANVLGRIDIAKRYLVASYAR
jgi:hypothetical protein